MLFSEGISYTETGRTVTNEVIDNAPDELYILSGKKVSELNYDKEISLSDEDYNIWFVDENKGLYITSNLDIYRSDDTSVRLNVRKRSMGHSKTDAARKSEALLYNYRISGDTILLDEYFTVPSERKWSFDEVHVQLYVPKGQLSTLTIIPPKCSVIPNTTTGIQIPMMTATSDLTGNGK